jgi:hypothetical protein
VNQNPDGRLGLIEHRFYRPLTLAVRTGPEISGDGGQVRIPE